MDLTFSKYGFQKNGEQITGFSISEINKNIKYSYIGNGIVRIKFEMLLLSLLVFCFFFITL